MAALHEELKQAMTLGIGIVTTADGLLKATGGCSRHRGETCTTAGHSLGDLTAAIEIEDLCTIGTVCAQSALAREESRAAHYRDDFPAMDTSWVRTVTYGRNGVGERAIAVDPQEAGRFAATETAKKACARTGEREYVE